jgi:GntR family transcriptional regulator
VNGRQSTFRGGFHHDNPTAWSFADLSPEDSRPLYEQIADQIRASIVAGVWRTGQQLPSSPAIGRRYGVNPDTALAGVRVLEGEGLLRVVRGFGTFVCGRPS